MFGTVSAEVVIPTPFPLPAASNLVGHALVEAVEPVVRQLFPWRRVGDVLVRGRTDAGISIDHSHAHAGDLAERGIAREQRRAARTAEELLEAALRRPGAHVALALGHAPRARLEACRRLRPAPGAVLAARAVAVDGDIWRLVGLEANSAAAAAAGEHQLNATQSMRRSRLASRLAITQVWPPSRQVTTRAPRLRNVATSRPSRVTRRAPWGTGRGLPETIV